MINTSLVANYPENVPDRRVIHQLDTNDLDRLKRWQTRTVLAMGTDDSALIYQREVIKVIALVSPLAR
jgi:hypothetical protein